MATEKRSAAASPPVFALTRQLPCPTWAIVAGLCTAAHFALIACLPAWSPAGTSRKPPVNPMLQYASDVLGLQLRPKQRDGPLANVLYGGWAH